jgi:hypothetical protein
MSFAVTIIPYTYVESDLQEVYLDLTKSMLDINAQLKTVAPDGYVIKGIHGFDNIEGIPYPTIDEWKCLADLCNQYPALYNSKEITDQFHPYQISSMLHNGQLRIVPKGVYYGN